MGIISVMPGVKVYKNERYSVLFGCPPEIIKHLIIQGIDFPDYIVLPDVLFQNGILQNCTEFPLYYFLFVLGNYAKGRKLTIIGDKKQVESNRDLLRLTLLGPTENEYKNLGENCCYESLFQESRYLSVKDKSGMEVPIDGFINFIIFHKNKAETPELKINHKDKNIFEINGELVDINFTEIQYPAYEVKADFVPMMPHKFGIDILGGGSGFTPSKPSSAVLLNYNSDYMLVDCLPYLDYNLNARGISKQQLKSIYLTHIHDDHCNIFPLVLFNTKLKFIGTKEIYWMALKKLSLQTMHEIDEFYSYFDFVEVKPYEENDFYGITIIPHYSVHSIPTIGATFKIADRGRDFTIVYTGDNKSLPEIKKMVDLKVVSQDKYEKILRLYRDRFDILFADGGMGILHGDPEDSIHSESDRVVFLHLEKLPEKFNATFSMAVSGKRYILLESKNDAYLIKTLEIFHKNFPGISEEWVTALMNNINIIMLNSGDVIIKQGEVRKGNIYIILSGSCSVMYHDGKALKEIAVKEVGDFIGEMAIIKEEERRSASVVAKTPVILCEMNERIYYLFLKEENRVAPIIDMWDIRKKLEANYPFSTFSDMVNERIAKVSVIRKVKAFEEVIRQGEKNRNFYIVLEGKFSVIRDGIKINTISNGTFFGEIGALEAKKRNATIQAETDGVLLSLTDHDIEKIIDLTPSLHFIVHQYMKERKE